MSTSLFLFGAQAEQLSALATGCVSRILPVAEQERLGTDLANLTRVLQSDIPLQLEPEFSPGRGPTRRLADGPLAGLTGQANQAGSQTRLVVGVDYLSQGISILIDAESPSPAAE